MADLAIFSPTRLSRQLRRLLDIGVIKRVARTYRYYLTKVGRCGGMINRGGYCSNTDSMGFLPSCHSTQNVPRVGW
jgi:hypothetical protein